MTTRECGCLEGEICSKCDLYMKDERAKSIEGFIASLEIFAKYTSKGMTESYFLGAEHDIIYCWINVPKNSEDGKRLTMLGWHHETESDSWGYFT